jgi:putative transposase
MPRHKRLEISSGICHVIQRGIERREIFKDDADREEFLRRLEEGLNATGSKCYGWALMPNHFHLLIRTGVKPLSDLMRKLSTGYAMYFNARHKRRGYVYQNRYKSIFCQEESYLLELVRYIHLNPLRGRLVKDMVELNNYKWSGHAALMGRRKAVFQSTGEILERFGNTKQTAIKGYVEFVQEAKDKGRRDDLTGGGLRRSAGGWSGVFALRGSGQTWRGDERVLGDGAFVDQVLKDSEEEILKRERLTREGWDSGRIIKRVCTLFGISESQILKRGRESVMSRARGVAAYWMNKELGISCADIGKKFGITKQSAREAAMRGESIVKDNGYVL